MDEGAKTLDVIDAIFSTRAARRLRPDPIPDDVVWAVLDAAIRGPSSGNCQRWGWVVVRDETTKRLIGRWYLDAWDNLPRGRRYQLRQLARRVLGHTDTPDPADFEPLDDPNLTSGRHLARNIAKAPVLVFAVVRGVRGEPGLVDGADIFGAVQNLMLAARKYGVGSTLTMLHRHHERDIGRLLRLPSDAQAIALLPLGYPVSGTFSTPIRNPVESVTHWERWGSAHSRVGVS